MAIAAICLAFSVSSLVAEEKNGLRMTVGKTTLDRNDRRNSYIYSDRIDRTQALKVTIKNVSFKEMPEGELLWKVVVKKYYGGTTEGSSGKETLKALKPAETVELTIGAAQIRGWGDMSGVVKDKMEHQVVVMQSGKESVRVESTPAFDAIAKSAVFTSSETRKP